jgi:hypothetical protein
MPMKFNGSAMPVILIINPLALAVVEDELVVIECLI